jgi:hypothetical protein
MAKSRQPTEADPPLYIRWTPDICPYALEMRLDLITRLKGELDQAEALGVEIGGVFVGVFPTPDSPTLRLDDVVFVPRNVIAGNVAGGAEFSLDPAQLQRLAQMTAEARYTERPAVGFFRSHLREDPLVPSQEDMLMLRPQFPEGLYAFLLIGPPVQPSTPRVGAFYLAITGRLPESPSTPVFPFEETAFQSLPEVPAEATEDVRNFAFTRSRTRRSIPWAAVISFVLLLFLIGSWIFGSRISQMYRPPSNQIDLSVISAGSNLKITWDHSTPVLSNAFGATLVIMDGSSHHEIKLDSDDLRFGQISYERLSHKVYVVMRIESPDRALPPQTFDWTGD